MSAVLSAAEPDAQPVGTDDLRAFLRNELASRCARNPRYSLRAFGRDVGINHSTLSKLLRGRRALGLRTIEQVCGRMGLSKAQCQRFIVAERLWRRQSDDEPRRIRRLGRDVSTLLSDWRHFAILELTRLDSFQTDSRWIARVLGSSPDEIDVAIQRLLRFGLLQMTERGRWTANTPSTPISFGDFVDAVSLQLATHAQGVAGNAQRDHRPRDHMEATLAVDSRRINAAIEIMERCRADVTRLLTGSDQKDDVYRLEINLTPVTTGKP